MQVQIIWSYILIFVLGCLLYSFLYIEYQQNTKLIKNNQAFIQKAIVKTVKGNQKAKLNQLPDSADYFRRNWKSIKPTFWVIEEGHTVYPFRFLGKKSKVKSKLWERYEKNPLDQLPAKTQKRVLSIHKIRSLKRQGHSKLLEEEIQNYLYLIENFKLSPLEEVISGLVLLKEENGVAWSREFIELFIADGTDYIKPLVDYLFINNSSFTETDAKTAFRQIYRLYKSKNINADWLKFNEKKFWQPSPIENTSDQLEYSLVNNTVLLQRNHTLFYALPFDLNSETLLVEKELKSRGLLDAEDGIQTPENIHYPDLSSVQFLVNRVRWDKQRFSQKVFFSVKMIVLTISLFILFYLLKTLNIRYQNYRAYLDLRQNFLNMVNHELKTPLASIRIMVEALEKRVRQNMDMKDYPKRIVNQLDKLWLMVDNLLSLNRIKSGEYIADYTHENVYELLESLSSRIQESSQQTLFIKNSINNDTVLFVDRMLFELLLNNLIANAIKYCDKSQVVMHFEHGKADGQFLLHDNGRGIDSAEWHRVFDEFYRGERQQKGTGVGLALCKRIMKLHQGEINILSSTKEGTSWCLTFALDKHNNQAVVNTQNRL